MKLDLKHQISYLEDCKWKELIKHYSKVKNLTLALFCISENNF